MEQSAQLSSNIKGRYAELLAQNAFLANGYEVSEPVSPIAYDLVVRSPLSGELSTVQVKTAFLRDEERYGGEYLVVKGARNSGAIYEKDSVDMFAAIWDGEVYLFPNREKSEYWIRPENLETKWTKLNGNL